MRISSKVISRTCETEPGAAVKFGEYMVWIESIMQTSNCVFNIFSFISMILISLSKNNKSLKQWHRFARL